MSAAVEHHPRAKLADTNPAYCSGCWDGADATMRFVDFDGPVIDRGQREEIRDGVVWNRESIDELILCERCVRDAAQALELKPDLHQRQLREIRRLELQVEHWRDYAKRMEATVASKPADEPLPTRPRKVR